MSEGPWAHSLRMRSLPKAEWVLLKMLQERFGLADPCEVLTVLLRTAYELCSYGEHREGYHLLVAVINQWRSDPDEVRRYELPEPPLHRPVVAAARPI